MFVQSPGVNIFLETFWVKMVTPHRNQVDFLGMVDPWNLGLLKHRVSFFLGGGEDEHPRSACKTEKDAHVHMAEQHPRKFQDTGRLKKHSTTMISAKGEEGTHLGC